MKWGEVLGLDHGGGGSNSELPVHGYTMAGMSMLGSLEDQARRSKAKRADW